MSLRTYTELSALGTFLDRFQYLRLSGTVGKDTFGFDRYVNQRFYTSREWKAVRDFVITRDLGCDLGVPGYEIYGRVFIHHINPILIKDIEQSSDILLNPEYLISTTPTTHNAIHYGDEGLLPKDPIDRTMNDTCPWRKTKQ
jgi:hypothetical protein